MVNLISNVQQIALIYNYQLWPIILPMRLYAIFCFSVIYTIEDTTCKSYMIFGVSKFWLRKCDFFQHFEIGRIFKELFQIYVRKFFVETCFNFTKSALHDLFIKIQVMCFIFALILLSHLLLFLILLSEKIRKRAMFLMQALLF